jgi:hypothetical protein
VVVFNDVLISILFNCMRVVCNMYCLEHVLFATLNMSLL